MTHYIGVRRSIAVVRANTLLLRGCRDRLPSTPWVNSGAALGGSAALERLEGPLTPHCPPPPHHLLSFIAQGT